MILVRVEGIEVLVEPGERHDHGMYVILECPLAPVVDGDVSLDLGHAVFEVGQQTVGTSTVNGTVAGTYDEPASLELATVNLTGLDDVGPPLLCRTVSLAKLVGNQDAVVRPVRTFEGEAIIEQVGQAILVCVGERNPEVIDRHGRDVRLDAPDAPLCSDLLRDGGLGGTRRTRDVQGAEVASIEQSVEGTSDKSRFHSQSPC